jgi:SAM-dependent methyltransferase
MSAQIEIFDKKLLKIRYERARRDNFLLTEARQMLDERLEYVRRSFVDIYEISRFDEVLPAGETHFDLIKSSLELHFINDLVGVLAQSMRALRPDGLFLANFFGGDTLPELRHAFALAAPDAMSPRISPFIDVKDAGALLQRAGFALPVVDSEKIEIVFDSAYHLMRFLREMGETNALIKQHKGLTGKNFMLA